VKLIWQNKISFQENPSVQKRSCSLQRFVYIYTQAPTHGRQWTGLRLAFMAATPRWKRCQTDAKCDIWLLNEYIKFGRDAGSCAMASRWHPSAVPPLRTTPWRCMREWKYGSTRETEQVGIVIHLYTCIPVVLGWNLDQDTRHPDWSFLVFLFEPLQEDTGILSR
jgi:hypothetical protein